MKTKIRKSFFDHQFNYALKTEINIKNFISFLGKYRLFFFIKASYGGLKQC